MKRLKTLLLLMLTTLLVGCSQKEELSEWTPEQDVFTNNAEFIDSTPTEWVDKLSGSIGNSEKAFYDEFNFISFDEDKLLFEVEAVSFGNKVSLFYQWSEEHKDFTVGNSMN